MALRILPNLTSAGCHVRLPVPKLNLGIFLLDSGNTSVWLENGKKFLDYLKSDRRFSALSLKDSLDEQGVFVDEDALVHLLTNMRTLSEQ
jgi:hypothetical protein